MKKYLNIAIACLVGMAMTACIDHQPNEEDTPSQKIDFSYEVMGDQYTLDYYVGATLRLFPTMEVDGKVEWDFNGAPFVIDEQDATTITGKFTVAGNYKVTAKGNGGAKTNVIYIADIRPIVTQVMDPETTQEGLIEVGSSYVSFDVELPNPDSLAAIYEWQFPEGTTDVDGNPVVNITQKFEARSLVPDVALGKVKFAKVGSQSVKLQVKLQKETGATEYRNLDIVVKNVQVALNSQAPTLYYVVKDGTINALKLPETRTVEGVTIEPYDLGVSSGQHMLNICYDDSLIYMFDCGKQYVYINDVDGVLGDGKIQVMSADAASIGMVITNVGGTAFKDPFYGFIEGDFLYFADRNTGFRKMNKTERNKIWTSSEYPSYVENNWLGYYGNSTTLIYGAFNACFGREDGVWYWCKKGNGAGCWRFTDADNHHGSADGKSVADWPAAGQLFEGTPCTAYAHDKTRGVWYFAFTGPNAGFYRIPDANLNTFNPMVTDGTLNEFLSYECKFEDGGEINPITSGDTGLGEGGIDEWVGVSQITIDDVTGDAFFGYRSSDEKTVPSGLIRYNNETGKLEHLVKGIKVYGVTVCPIQSKLFY